MSTPPSTRLPATYLDAEVRLEAACPIEEVVRGLDDITVEREPGYPTVFSDGRGHTVVAYEGVGSFELVDGRHVVVRHAPDVDPDAVLAALHNGVPSLLLAQQGRYALHATTVDIGGVCVAVAGPSGAGKSTTSLALVQRGARPVVDDVTVLDVVDSQAITRSFGRPVHAFPHVIAQLGIDRATATGAGRSGRKVALDWPEAAPIAVDVVIRLRPCRIDSVQIEHVTGAAAVRTLHHVTHMRRLLRPSHGERMFSWCASVTAAVCVGVLRRPEAGWPLDDLCDEIERFARSHATAPGGDVSERRSGSARP